MHPTDTVLAAQALRTVASRLRETATGLRGEVRLVDELAKQAHAAGDYPTYHQLRALGTRLTNLANGLATAPDGDTRTPELETRP